LGIKKTAQSGALYPSATDYFVVPPEVAEKLGEKPTELPILFPIEDDEKFASQYYRCYSMTRGLVCRGDGEASRRMVDTKTGEMANRETEEIEWKDGLPCEGRECPYYKKQCREVMNLQFVLPTVEGLGIWQIDTSSINSIKNINSAIELIRGVFGRIAMIPLLLTLEPIEITSPDTGKKKIVRVLNLRTKGTMLELLERTAKPAREMLLPAPVDTEEPLDVEAGEGEGASVGLPESDKEVPELIVPQNQAPEGEIFPEEPEPELEFVGDQAVGEAEPVQASKIIDIEWFKESLKTLREKKLTAWYEKNLLSYMKTTYKVEAMTVIEAVGKLDEGTAQRFVKKLQDTLDMA